MLVAASTACFPDLTLHQVMERLNDLEYSRVEIQLNEQGGHLKPSDVLADVHHAIAICQSTLRMDVVGYEMISDPNGPEYFDRFEACCKLAKGTKVVNVIVESSERGTPFNEEVERLRKLVGIAQNEGVRVSMKTMAGCLSEDPDTVTVLCDNAPGLGLTLDPSHYICGPFAGRNFDKLMKYVHSVHLRDTSPTQLQVLVGQGEADFGRIIQMLEKVHYDRALVVHMQQLPDIDFSSEMRKMRLLLESLIL